MISITLSQAAEVLHGDLHGQDLTIDAVTTDTRKVTAGCLFVALKGERFDAHALPGAIDLQSLGAVQDFQILGFLEEDGIPDDARRRLHEVVPLPHVA